MSGEQRVHIPIIKLYDTLIVTIQVELSDKLVLQLKEDIGSAVQRLGPSGLIIDVSGVEIIDSYISRALRDIGLMSRLMGVEAVISGLDPNIAMALTEMGLDLEGVGTFLHLEAAFEALQADHQATVADGATDADESGWWR